MMVIHDPGTRSTSIKYKQTLKLGDELKSVSGAGFRAFGSHELSRFSGYHRILISLKEGLTA